MWTSIILCLAVVVVGDSARFCDNGVFCDGELLHTIQMAELYPDSKTFVDMKLCVSPNETSYKFKRFMTSVHDRPTRNELKQFVSKNFDPVGSEFQKWIPPDWKEEPAVISRIKDPAYRQWATELNAIWLKLGKKMKTDVYENSNLYSIIPVPNPVIVPGGRFREFYYWDSYWIVKGLLRSEMYHTVKGMLENFLSMVDRFGYVPNGGRIYYLGRSQPPLLLPMVEDYVAVTRDVDFLRMALPTLELEFSYWMSNHNIPVIKDGINYTVFRYVDSSRGPRPESHREDVESAMVFQTEAEKEDLYSEIKSTAESGWDFSSRWYIQNDLKTKSIIPVDLNAIMCWNAELLSQFYQRLGDTVKSAEYAAKKAQIVEAVKKVLWVDSVGIWLDFDIINQKERNNFYPSNLSPLWTGCYNPADKEYIVGKVMKYVQSQETMLNRGGILTTLNHTGEQWDYPNAWPPLQHIMIMSLVNSGDARAQELAFEIASRWVRSNFIAYKETGHMFEKYDATIPGGLGTGGEYEMQIGFGWTNGVILDLLDRYSDTLLLELD